MNAALILNYMRKINSRWDEGEVLISDYCEVYTMWTQLLRHLGAAMTVAFSDTKEKAQDILDNQDLFTY